MHFTNFFTNFENTNFSRLTNKINISIPSLNLILSIIPFLNFPSSFFFFFFFLIHSTLHRFHLFLSSSSFLSCMFTISLTFSLSPTTIAFLLLFFPSHPATPQPRESSARIPFSLLSSLQAPSKHALVFSHARVPWMWCRSPYRPYPPATSLRGLEPFCSSVKIPCPSRTGWFNNAHLFPAWKTTIRSLTWV